MFLLVLVFSLVSISKGAAMCVFEPARIMGHIFSDFFSDKFLLLEPTTSNVSPLVRCPFLIPNSKNASLLELFLFVFLSSNETSVFSFVLGNSCFGQL